MARRDFPIRAWRLQESSPKDSKPPDSVPPADPPEERFQYSDPTHPGHILAGLCKQWSESSPFLDVTVRVGNTSVRGHKSVLSAFSRYFEVLFSFNRNDSGSDEVELHDISGTAFEMLVGFAYTGKLDILPDNVQDLLVAANFLCVDSVIDACCLYLHRHLTLDNCIDVIGLAMSLDQLKLRQSTEAFIIGRFEEFVQQKHFLRCPVDIILQLLAKDEMVITRGGFLVSKAEQEETILRLILQYVDSKPDVNREHLPRLLLHGVRMMSVPAATLAELKSSSLISTSAESLGLVNRALSSQLSEEERRCWEKPRSVVVLRFERSKVLASTPAVISEAPSEEFDDKTLGNDGECLFVAGMKIYIRRWDGIPVVGGLEVHYSCGRTVLHGANDYRREEYEFSLNPGERIIAINARSGWMVDQLLFTTSQKRVFGPYGGTGGSKHNISAPSRGAYLAYITGTVDVTQAESAVRKLCFVWGYPESRRT